jgi:hypothetical protein
MHSLFGVPDFLHLYLKLHYFVVVFWDDRVCEISRLRRVRYRKGEGEHVMTCKVIIFVLLDNLISDILLCLSWLAIFSYYMLFLKNNEVFFPLKVLICLVILKY